MSKCIHAYSFNLPYTFTVLFYVRPFVYFFQNHVVFYWLYQVIVNIFKLSYCKMFIFIWLHITFQTFYYSHQTCTFFLLDMPCANFSSRYQIPLIWKLVAPVLWLSFRKYCFCSWITYTKTKHDNAASCTSTKQCKTRWRDWRSCKTSSYTNQWNHVGTSVLFWP